MATFPNDTNIPDAPTLPVAVPEWDGVEVVCKTLSALDLDKLEMSHSDDEGKLQLEGYRLAYVAACLGLEKPEDVAKLKQWGTVVNRLFGICRKHNGGDAAKN